MNGNLLICDDEELILESLSLLLEEFAEKIYTATNGEECLKVLDMESIDCIVCDINMPKMGGMEVIRELNRKGSRIPFIFYAAHGTDEIMKDAKKYGAFEFVHKPGIEELELAVKRGMEYGTKLKNSIDGVDSD